MKAKIIALLLLCANTIVAQQNLKYDKICYCSGRETPHSIVSFDNNLQLLVEFKNGLSRKDLDSLKIPYTKSQLKLLEVYNLIERVDGKYITQVQILDSVQAVKLREQSYSHASEIFPLIEKDIVKLANYMKGTFTSRNEFSILFSYVLDGLIWDEFKRLKLINPVESDENIMTWKGHFWMIPFPRDTKCGTNSSSVSSATIYITNGVPWRFMKPLYDNYDLLEQMISDISSTGSVSNNEVISEFKMYNIYNDKGEVKVPIIKENSQNKIFELSDKISKELAQQFLKTTSVTELVDNYKFQNNEIAYIVYYHELMWDLMAIIEQKDIVARPEILINSEFAKMKDMSDLIFFVVKE